LKSNKKVVFIPQFSGKIIRSVVYLILAKGIYIGGVPYNAYFITDACISCGACESECPVFVFHQETAFM